MNGMLNHLTMPDPSDPDTSKWTHTAILGAMLPHLQPKNGNLLDPGPLAHHLMYKLADGGSSRLYTETLRGDHSLEVCSSV